MVKALANAVSNGYSVNIRDGGKKSVSLGLCGVQAAEARITESHYAPLGLLIVEPDYVEGFLPASSMQSR